jgi:propionate CoA-transferase
VLEADELGLIVIEIAPGVDLERDVLPNFAVRPRVSDRMAKTPDLVFQPGPFGLREVLKQRPARTLHRRLASLLSSGG